MKVWVNGESRDVDPTTTLAALLDAQGVPGRGVAVAVDDTVVPRASWASRGLDDGARVEILTAVQGG